MDARRLMTPAWIVSFAGHRRLDDPAAVRAAVERVLRQLGERATKAGGVVELYGSAAVGADLLFHEVAAALHLPFHVALPLPLPSFRDDFSAEDWASVSAHLERAASVHVAMSNAERPGCYADANFELVSGCDALVVVWDGEPARGPGGTAELVSQARAMGLPVVIIAPDGRTATERLEAFTADDGRAVLERMLSVAGRPVETPSALREALDAVALGHSEGFREAQVRLIIATAIAAVVGSLAAVIPRGPSLVADVAFAALMLAEASIVLWSVLRRRRLAARQVHERWLDARFGAEIIRSLEATSGLLDLLSPLIARVEPAWRRFAVMVNLALLRAGPPPRWEVLKERYLHGRLLGATEGQVPYFERKAAQAAPLSARARRWSGIFSRMALVFALLSFTWKALQIAVRVGLGSPDALAQPVLSIIFRFLPVALPVLAGSAGAIEAARDGGRRQARYPVLASILRARSEQLAVLTSETSVRRTVTRVEELLLIELMEWRLAEQRNARR